MRKVCLVLGMAALLPLVSSQPASAQAQYTMAQRNVIANEDVFIMRASSGDMTPEQRMDRVNERLAYILGYENLSPGNIRLVDRGGAFDIVVGRSHLVTVTAADARANGTRNIRGLAGVWLRNLRRALPQARPGFAVAAVPSAERIAQR